MTLFSDKIKVSDECSVVGNSFIPDHTDAKILEINRENGTAKVEYTLSGEKKTRNIEIGQICPPFSNFVNGMAECFAMLAKIA